MTRTHEDHEMILAPYYDSETGLIDTRAFIRDFNTDAIAAVYGPATGDPNEDTLQIAYQHNQIVTEEASAREVIRGAWLARFAALVVGLVGTLGSYAALVAIV